VTALPLTLETFSDIFVGLLMIVLLIISVNANEVPGVARAILTDPGFQLESIRFVLGDEQGAPRLGKVKPFSFYNCK
jgi:hypothetical protein